MKITLNLFASFTPLLPQGSSGNSCTIELPADTTIDEVIKMFKIPNTVQRLIFLNGIHANETDRLKDNDRLSIFPPIAGG
jgi:molybdopterin converting factor small subunit